MANLETAESALSESLVEGEKEAAGCQEACSSSSKRPSQGRF